MTIKEQLKASFKLLHKLVKKPKSIFLILKDETEYFDYLSKKYGKTEFPTVDINYFIGEKSVEIDNYTFLEGGSLITDLALLKSIASNFKTCDYLEIGTWRGESIVNVAEVSESHCVSINLSPEQIIDLGLPQKYANEHGCLIKNKENIQTIYADSLSFDFSSLNRKFDLIFVYGDHKYESVKSDTKNVFNLLKDNNSIIVWHDYGFDPTTPRYSVISAILDGIPDEEHQCLYHVSNTMCALYTKQDLTSFLEIKSDSPNKIFEVSIQSKPFVL
jgi:predicted O-methyltransferase YrrM